MFRSPIVVWICCLLCITTSLKSQTKWVSTWGTANQLVEPHNMPPAPGLSHHILRQVVRVSIGGDSLRCLLSNEFGQDSVQLKAVFVSASAGGYTIDSLTSKKLTFKGAPAWTMAPGTTILSDPVAFKLTPRMDVAITIQFGNTSSTLTGHPGSRTTSYLLAGQSIQETDFSNAIPTDHWYVINRIDVRAPSSAAAVAILGNSITDGRGSGTNKQNRWPDILAERLIKNKSTKQVSVLNMGIGGNCVLRGGLGPTGLKRFERDIINQPGVRWAIILEGVNDIGGIPDNESAALQTSQALIQAYQQMILTAHAHQITIYGATIMPFKHHSYYTSNREKARQTVNQWIRTSKAFDGVIDFDKIMRDPADSSSLHPSYQEDYLHPNEKGYQKMGESIDLSLFD